MRIAPAQDGAWVDESGWYINTVHPPVDWISNDPFGPYDTLAELRKDTFRSYREQDTEEAAVDRWG